MTDEQPNFEIEERTSHRAVWASQLFKTALFALILFLLARLVILPYEVEGRSMTPNLVNHERVLVNRAVYSHFDAAAWLGWVPGVDVENTDWYPFHSPAQGDVIVLNPPQFSETPYIKRTIALAGDTVDIRDGAVYVNGERLDEPYLDGLSTTCDDETWCHDFVVPEGTVYVLGDNRGESFDSRVIRSGAAGQHHRQSLVLKLAT